MTRAETIDEEAVEIEVLSNRLRCPKDSDIISIPYRSLSLAIITNIQKRFNFRSSFQQRFTFTNVTIGQMTSASCQHIANMN